jgi:hypothetical protein
MSLIAMPLPIHNHHDGQLQTLSHLNYSTIQQLDWVAYLHKLGKWAFE